MATDHIGPFLLTKLFAPKLLASATPSYVLRVVFVSSNAHTFSSGANFKTIRHPDPASYQSFEAYFQAKSAKILTAIEGRITAYSLCPGGCSLTSCGIDFSANIQIDCSDLD